MKNIVIVGFMGTGKTAVAKTLARELKLTYVSIDETIAEREKRPIKDIFRDSGEPYFRKLEKDVVREVSARRGQVIDTGGGVVLDAENMRNLGSNGLVVCLWAEPSTIYERTRRSSARPLLNVDDPLARIRDLLEERRPFYEKAEFHVHTDGEGIADVAGKIKKMVEESGRYGE